MKKSYLVKAIILSSLISIIHAQESGIEIQGDVNGGFYNNQGDVNHHYHQSTTKRYIKNIKNVTLKTTYRSFNITNNITTDNNLLEQVKKQFSSGFIRLESLNNQQRQILNQVVQKVNYSLSQQGKIIIKQNQLIYGQKKLLDGQGKLLDGQGKLIDGQGNLLHNQEILVDNQGLIYNTQGQILNNQAYLVTNQGHIINGIGELMGGQIKIIQIVQDTNNIVHRNYQTTQNIQQGMNEVVKFIKEPAIQKTRALMSDSCQRIGVQNINQISFNPNNIDITSNSIDSDNIRCMGEIYKRSKKNFFIHLEHADINTANKVAEIAKIDRKDIDWGGNQNVNKVTVSTTYKTN